MNINIHILEANYSITKQQKDNLILNIANLYNHIQKLL
ncbi:hypothetical protein pb186bvf_006025 [Paramecium bursaria]